MSGMEAFWLCFVPLFVAVDAVGVLPTFLTLTANVPESRVRRVIIQSLLTAALVIVAFLAFGPQLLEFLGITVPDFTIAGGILLLAIALGELLSGQSRKALDMESLGAVPLGVPMIAGPAVLTTSVLLSNAHGAWVTTLAASANVLLAGVVFLFAKPIERLIGRTGTKTVSKVASLLLAAIAVMLIRRGITDTIAAMPR